MKPLLPFKTYSGLQVESYDIADAQGNVILIPKYGSLTWNEQEAYSQYSLKAAQDPELSMGAFEIELVTLMLRLRFGLPPNTSKEEILAYPDSTPFSADLIRNIYQFFQEERNGWRKIEEIEVVENGSPKK